MGVVSETCLPGMCIRCNRPLGKDSFVNQVDLGGTVTTYHEPTDEMHQETVHSFSNIELCKECQKELWQFLGITR